MMEVTARCGVARTGTWRLGSTRLELPAVLFFTSPRFPPPLYASALLASSPISDTRPVVIDRGSIFLPQEEPKELSIPPNHAVPPGLRISGIPEQGAGAFKVVSGPQEVDESGPQAYVLGGAASYLRDPRGFVELMTTLRTVVGPSRIIYAPGIALPSNLAMLVYSGVDVVDSLAALFEAGRGRWLSSDGASLFEQDERPPCRCSACLSSSGRRALVDHDEIALWEEMELVRACIKSGTLRELVERRAVNSPWNTAVLRHLDLRHYDFQELHFPVVGRRLNAYSHQSLTRPDIVRFRRRIKERYLKPPSAKVLLLLPCSARKPYSLSRSHRKFREAVMSSGNPWAVHEVVVTSPLGIVPRELELTYPAAHYDIPVTGDWSRDESAIVREDIESFLGANKYDRIVAHLDAERPFVEDVLGGASFTCKGGATNDESIAALANELRTTAAKSPKVDRTVRLLEDMTCLARFQFGAGGEALLEGAQLRGRYPEIKILRGGKQLAMLTERGLFSLTLDGGSVLSENDLYCVEIDDFYPQGSVFAVGVDAANEEIRVGDDAVARHDGEVRAVGVAQMSWREMVESERGEAIKVRHALRSKPI